MPKSSLYKLNVQLEHFGLVSLKTVVNIILLSLPSLDRSSLHFCPGDSSRSKANA